MLARAKALSGSQKAVLLIIVCLVAGSMLYHSHPSMDGLQEQLRTKAPTLFKLFLGGEAVYFAGMVLMALGLGANLGANPLAWSGKFRALMAADSPGLARATAFWIGFACNAVGSLTFAVIGLYVAAKILPGGSWTLVPASLIDITFSVLVRVAFYRRFSRKPPAENKELSS